MSFLCFFQLQYEKQSNYLGARSHPTSRNLQKEYQNYSLSNYLSLYALSSASTLALLENSPLNNLLKESAWEFGTLELELASLNGVISSR